MAGRTIGHPEMTPEQNRVLDQVRKLFSEGSHNDEYVKALLIQEGWPVGAVDTVYRERTEVQNI